MLAPFKQANPDVTIKYTGAGDNVPADRLDRRSGRKPAGHRDPSAARPDEGLREPARAKPINFSRAVIARNYAPVWLQLGSVNGQLYGLFFKGANKSTIWYNVPAFRAAGVRPAPTWPRFIASAKTVRGSGTPAYSIGGADGWTLTDLFENIYLRTAGGAKYDLLSSHKIKWTNPSVKVALRYMAQVLGDTGNIAGGTAGRAADRLPDLGQQRLQHRSRRRRWCSRVTSCRASSRRRTR